MLILQTENKITVSDLTEYTKDGLVLENWLTFVEAFDAGVVKRLCHDFLQIVFTASAAGVHLHEAETKFLWVESHRWPKVF